MPLIQMEHVCMFVLLCAFSVPPILTVTCGGDIVTLSCVTLLTCGMNDMTI